jgi:hypothetical protein
MAMNGHALGTANASHSRPGSDSSEESPAGLISNEKPSFLSADGGQQICKAWTPSRLAGTVIGERP